MLASPYKCKTDYYRVYKRNQRALFTHAGDRDKLPDCLSALAGVLINQNNLFEFEKHSLASGWFL